MNYKIKILEINNVRTNNSSIKVMSALVKNFLKLFYFVNCFYYRNSVHKIGFIKGVSIYDYKLCIVLYNFT